MGIIFKLLRFMMYKLGWLNWGAPDHLADDLAGGHIS